MKLPELPQQPQAVPWPTRQWRSARAVAPAERFDAATSALWDLPEGAGATLALLVVQHGVIVYERYAEGVDANTPLRSWSMAKSVTQALAGMLVLDGKLDINAPINPPEWQGAQDPRAAITTRHLLEMRSGLAWNEDYVDRGVSDVMEMLWGSGSEDVAHFAAAKPLVHTPGSVFYYSSGTTNILARHLGALVSDRPVGQAPLGDAPLGDAPLGDRSGASEASMLRYMRERLFAPLGMTSATPKFDAAGTFIGSSFCFCTARDFARFGLLFLRDGIWDGQRLLPEGWVDYTRTMTHREQVEPHSHYGAQWWIADDEVTFYASGYETQRIVVAPHRDSLVVRLGNTPGEFGPSVALRVLAVLEALPTLR